MAVDRELIKGINWMIEGKEAGFNIVYSHTYNYVYGRAKMIMKDEDDALDLTQETFIQAYRNIHTLESANNIYAWLGAIVYRSGMKIYRKKRDVLVNEDGEGIFENVVSEDKDYRPEVTTEEKATSNIIMGMIEELPELQKAAILAFYYDNMKIDDIAELFECSPNTIKSRLNYAKKFLKDKVEMHEKQYAYRLHSLTPAVLFFALRSLLAGDTYKMSVAAAQNIYNMSCSALGVSPMAIAAVGEAGATYSTSVFTNAQIVAKTTTTATAAGASSVAGTTTTAAAATTAAATTAAAGTLLGTKIAIGVVAFALVGTLAAGGVVLANNGFFDNIFGEESMVDDEEEDKEDEEEVDETETVEDTEEGETGAEEVVVNYADIMQTMKSSQYITDSITDEDHVLSITSAAFKTMSAGSGFDFKDMSDIDREFLNYQLLNNMAITVPTADANIENAYGMVYDEAVLDEYFAAVYENGDMTVTGNSGFQSVDGYVVFMPSDGDSWILFGSYIMYSDGDYVLVEMPCYEEDNGGNSEYVYTASVLLKYTGDELSPYQLLRAEAYDNTVNVNSATATSQLSDYNNITYSPSNLFDGDYATAWVENVSGVGVGESITIDLGSEQEIQEIVIFNGYLSTYYAYNNNGKVTKVQIDCENGPSIVADVNVYEYYSTAQTAIDMPVAARIGLGETVTTSKITITILEAEAGSAYEDTCISEIEIH